MAYAFNNLTDLLSNQNNSNIFGPTGSQGNFGPTAPNQNAQAPRVDTAGDIGGSDGAGSGKLPAASSMVTQTPDMSAYSRNYGKAQNPGVFSNIANTINKRAADLQKEADQTVAAGKAQQSYGLAGSEIDKAIKGDTKAQGSVTGLLNRADIKQVNPWIMKTDTSIRDAELASPEAGQAGLRDLISRDKAPTYTRGMGDFDVAMLSGNRDFDAAINKIQSNYKNLQDTSTKLQGEVPQTIADYGKGQLAAAKGQAGKYLEGKKAGILAEEKKAVDAANQKLKDALKGKGQVTENEMKKAVAKVKADMEAIRPGSSFAVDLIKSPDGSSYFTPRASYKASDLITQDQASRFNNIAAMLGLSDAQIAGAGAGKAFTVDKEGMYNDVMKAAKSALAADDTKSTAEKKKILGNVAALAKKVNASEATFDMKAAAKEKLDAALKKYNIDYSGVDINKYLKADERPDATLLDLLSKADADRLNALNARLGVQEPLYQAGKFDQSRPWYTFDQKGYETDLENWLRSQHVSPSSAVGEYKQGREIPTAASPTFRVGSSIVTGADYDTSEPSVLNIRSKSENPPIDPYSSVPEGPGRIGSTSLPVAEESPMSFSSLPGLVDRTRIGVLPGFKAPINRSFAPKPFTDFY